MDFTASRRRKMSNRFIDDKNGTSGMKATSAAQHRPVDASGATISHVGVPEYRKLENYIFGSSAAIITNVSLIVGLGSAGAGKGPILGGLLTMAVADNISDSLGIHLYKESEGFGESLSSLATVLNFLSRLFVSLSFIAIVLACSVHQSILAGIVWAILLLNIVSYLLTRANGNNSALEIIKHVSVAVVVIALSRWLGCIIADHF
ncbi:MAG TPA: hypothetical protein VMG34_12970 [Bacteroidota bacterium]|nr:hypothetical protein [Bacteroidota bacterium]